MSDELLRAATINGSDAYTAVQILLKGPERDLPGGATFTDHDGNVRSKMRVRWWVDYHDDVPVLTTEL